MTTLNPSWTPDSWKSKRALQQPTYPDQNELAKVEAELTRMPPLVTAHGARDLKKSLAEVSEGKAFLLQGGDCAESFGEFNTENLMATFRILLQMSVVLTHGGKLPIVKVGRMAGQFAKPRSSDTETKNDVTLPSYRGDIINDIDFTKDGRVPNPKRMLKAYGQSASTMNFINNLAGRGYADLHSVNSWNLDFMKGTMQADKYTRVADDITCSLEFMEACGINKVTAPVIKGADFYYSHEALLLPYEQALTRVDSTDEHGRSYDLSGHLLWIGDRTRDPDDAHVEFLRGVDNPLALKCGPTMKPKDLVSLMDRLNPENEAGRLTLIVRMGADNITQKLPPLIKAVKDSGHKVVWCSDPMHGNTVTSNSGYKTRDFDRVCQEVLGFFDTCQTEKVWPGGVHLEMTGRDVTECTGGAGKVTDAGLSKCYATTCDPRLNATQSLDLAFAVAKRLGLAKILHKSYQPKMG